MKMINRLSVMLLAMLLVLCSAAMAEAPVSCDFKTMTADEFLSIWSTPDTIDHFIDDEYWHLDPAAGLVITTQNGEVFATPNLGPNFFWQNGAGNYTIDVKINMAKAFPDNLQTTGIMIATDLDNYVRLVLTNEFGGHSVQWRQEIAGNVDWSNVYSEDLGNITTIYLRMKKYGNAYTGFYSVDGVEFIKIGSYTTAIADPMLTLLAFNSTYQGTSEEVDVMFEYVHVEETTAQMIVVVGDSASIRNQPSLSASKLGTAHKDDAFVMLEESGDWYILDYNGATGYIHKGVCAMQ